MWLISLCGLGPGSVVATCLVSVQLQAWQNYPLGHHWANSYSPHVPTPVITVKRRDMGNIGIYILIWHNDHILKYILLTFIYIKLNIKLLCPQWILSTLLMLVTLPKPGCPTCEPEKGNSSLRKSSHGGSLLPALQNLSSYIYQRIWYGLGFALW